MKKIFVTAAALTLTLGASAQGNNTGMGGDHEGCTSLAERVLKLEKKNDAFNVYINYAASFQETDNGTEWGSAFKNRQAPGVYGPSDGQDLLPLPPSSEQWQ